MSLAPDEQRAAAQLLLWLLLLLLSAWWLRGTLTPERFLTLFESEQVLSIRLVLAAVVVVFTLCMQAAGRLSAAVIEANYFLAGTLLGLGTAKLVGKAFAARPPEPPTQINAPKAKVAVSGETTIDTGEAGQTA